MKSIVKLEIVETGEKEYRLSLEANEGIDEKKVFEILEAAINDLKRKRTIKA